jgi:hypothetical protein
MSGISQKRELIKRAYSPSITWPAKVDKMTDSQVIAIFFKLKKQGKI